MRRFFLAIVSWQILLALAACTSNEKTAYDSLPADTATVARGEELFTTRCTSCHSLDRDGIGPALAGVTKRVDLNWLRSYIKNPQQLIDSGDEHALKLLEKYKVAMPILGLNEEELTSVIAFLHAHSSDQQVRNDTSHTVGLANPVPDAIELSSLVVNIEQVAQFPASDSVPPLARVTKLDYQPGTNQVFVNDLRGRLYRLRDNTPEVYLDLKERFPKFIHSPGLGSGLGSFAFHPDFTSNGLLYTTHSESPSAKADFTFADSIPVAMQWVLTEWKTTNPKEGVFSGTGRELLRINFISWGHGVQEIAFNPLAAKGDDDFGKLYVGVGDGAAVDRGYPAMIHSLERIWGSVIRIDPQGNNSANGHYGIPKTNPFADDKNPKTLKEIFAYGFRNPHRITWTQSGKMMVTNIGQSNIESLNWVEAGNDYGWPEREGSFVFNPYGDLRMVTSLPSDDGVKEYSSPVAMYDHDEGIAISGGYEYTGEALPELNGKFLFGDIPSGRLFYIDANDIRRGGQSTIKEWRIAHNNVTTTIRALGKSYRADLHFGRDARGEIYLMTKSDGKLYRLKGVVK